MVPRQPSPLSHVHESHAMTVILEVQPSSTILSVEPEVTAAVLEGGALTEKLIVKCDPKHQQRCSTDNRCNLLNHQKIQFYSFKLQICY